MEIKGLLTLGRSIWGEKKLNLAQVIVRMGKVFGDICRWERHEKANDRPNAAELEKEMGNMIFSTVRWCDDLGFDPEECVNLAIAAQKKFQNLNQNDLGGAAMDVGGLAVLSRNIWGEQKIGLDGIIIRMGKVLGDICRYARNAKPGDRGEGEEGLKKEFGNLIFSGIGWCGDLGYDPEECINIAVEAQKKYKEGRILNPISQIEM